MEILLEMIFCKYIHRNISLSSYSSAVHLSFSLFLKLSSVIYQWCLLLVVKLSYTFYAWLKIQLWNWKRSITLFVMIERKEAHWTFKLYTSTRKLSTYDCDKYKMWMCCKYTSPLQFLTFAERLGNVNIDIIHRIDRTASYDEVREC